MKTFEMNASKQKRNEPMSIVLRSMKTDEIRMKGMPEAKQYFSLGCI